MGSFSKAFTYVIAAQFQAIGLLLAGWWVGDWLDKNHALSFSWQAITMPVSVVVVAHTFYVMIRRAYLLTKDKEEKGT